MYAEYDENERRRAARVRAWCARHACGLRTERAQTIAAALRDGMGCRVRYDATRNVYELETLDGQGFRIPGRTVDAAGPPRRWREDATRLAKLMQALRHILRGELATARTDADCPTALIR